MLNAILNLKWFIHIREDEVLIFNYLIAVSYLFGYQGISFPAVEALL